MTSKLFNVLISQRIFLCLYGDLSEFIQSQCPAEVRLPDLLLPEFS